MEIKIIHDAKQATGLAVIIDVFRAFTVEPYLINNGVEKLIPVGDKEIAYNLKKKNKEYVLIGERKGIMLPGFDYGNSPSQIKNIDFSKKTAVHTTSCGTQGIVNAINAKEIITGSLVNASAIVRYIKQNKFEDISIVSISKTNKPASPEDELCARYIKSMLEDKPLENLKEEIENLKFSSGKKFFDSYKNEIFPQEDFYLCTEINKFDFVLKVNKDIEGMLYIEKIEI
ncbi:MAG: 2-phosphosulfolactate phosphatase [Candidatus Scatovivens sp.]